MLRPGTVLRLSSLLVAVLGCASPGATPGPTPAPTPAWRTAFMEGNRAQTQRSWPVAQQKFEEALGLCSSECAPADVGEIHLRLGRVYREVGNPDRSRDSYGKARPLFEAALGQCQGCAPKKLAELHEGLAISLFRTGDSEGALKEHRTAFDLYPSEDFAEALRTILRVMGREAEASRVVANPAKAP
jgi:tetratricopeptide (TPR) repeat protein